MANKLNEIYLQSYRTFNPYFQYIIKYANNHYVNNSNYCRDFNYPFTVQPNSFSVLHAKCFLDILQHEVPNIIH